MRHTLSGFCGAVAVQPLFEEEIEYLRLLRNRNRESFVFSDEITPEGQQAWYAQYLETPGDYMFSVYYKNNWIGAMAIYNVKDSCAEFGRLLIDRTAAGRGGLGIDATKAACQIAFEQLSVEQILLEVYCDNSTAIITYLKAGFQPISLFSRNGQKPMLRMALSKKLSTI